MNFLAVLLTALAIVAVLFATLWIGWRERSRRDAGVNLPTVIGEVSERFGRVLYVATTPLGQPMQRVHLPGLAFRGWSDVLIHDRGIGIALHGEVPRSLPWEQIDEITTVRTTAGKATEANGLVALRWHATGVDDGAQSYESTLRFPDPHAHIEFLEAATGSLADTQRADHRVAHTNTEQGEA